MTRYRNSKIEAEMQEAEQEDLFEQEMKEEPQTVEDATFKKRYSDLRRFMQQKEDERKAEIEALKSQLKAAATGSIRMPKTEAEVDEWSKQYPDFRATLDTIITKEVKAALRGQEEKVAKLEEAQKDVAKEKAMLELKRRHPDVEQLFKQNSDFHRWLIKQSKRAQDAILHSLDVDDAAFVIDKFKSETSGRVSKVEDDDFTSAAKVVRSSSEVSISEAAGDYDFSESQIERMTAKQYEANEEKIMTAIRKGRFLYDLSGGAR